MKNTLPVFIKANSNKQQKVQSMFSIITAMDFYDEGMPLKATTVNNNSVKKIWLKIKNIFC